MRRLRVRVHLRVSIPGACVCVLYDMNGTCRQRTKEGIPSRCAAASARVCMCGVPARRRSAVVLVRAFVRAGVGEEHGARPSRHFPTPTPLPLLVLLLPVLLLSPLVLLLPVLVLLLLLVLPVLVLSLQTARRPGICRQDGAPGRRRDGLPRRPARRRRRRPHARAPRGVPPGPSAPRRVATGRPPFDHR